MLRAQYQEIQLSPAELPLIGQPFTLIAFYLSLFVRSDLVMYANKKDQSIGLLLKALLKERSLSMRKLSALTGIDTATISRIANDKQQAKPEHLQQFAHHLGVPAYKLFKAAGFNFEMQPEQQHSDIHASVDTIQEILASSNLFDQQYTTERVQQELTKYEKYALTEEGKRIIMEEFQAKVDQVSGAGPFIDQLKLMHKLFCKNKMTLEERSIIGSALLYFVLSADIIPDYVFPFGYLDDAIAVQLVLNRLPQIKATAQQGDNQL
ncbi:DNA-binding helix-turn-helix protein [Aneurinibacillus aneurinilyticus ATCC 12856]|uniref:DNA-binding helix-turn-helix protein n=2 Tax=Aneurinibacillus aneurinilyticus TaxID=1391 RepID=U1Y7Z7_ANEAE|nr:DNA-binding helix-turn-helix protein [Aneurinibacillus aneurinilyticus ATCC 12856]